MVRLVSMTEGDFQDYIKRDVERYAQENVRAGYWTSSEALAESSKAHQRLLPDGITTKDHYLFTIEDDERGEVVGVAWLKAERRAALPYGFIYDLFVEEAFRGRGYATEAMFALEEKAQELGLSSLVLHVFAHNTAARALYEKLGYELRSLNMAKVLTPR